MTGTLVPAWLMSVDTVNHAVEIVRASPREGDGMTLKFLGVRK